MESQVYISIIVICADDATRKPISIDGTMIPIKMTRPMDEIAALKQHILINRICTCHNWIHALFLHIIARQDQKDDSGKLADSGMLHKPNE